MEKVIPDPVLSAFELPLRRTFYPFGFPLELETNSAEVIAAAAEGWGAFEQAFDEAPVRFCLGVTEASGDALPLESVVRSREHMMSIIADPENFVVCDFNRGLCIWMGDSEHGRRSSAAALSLPDCGSRHPDRAAGFCGAAWRFGDAKWERA